MREQRTGKRRREKRFPPSPFSLLCSPLFYRPKLIAPPSPNELLEPSSPTGMLMLGFTLNRE